MVAQTKQTVVALNSGARAVNCQPQFVASVGVALNLAPEDAPQKPPAAADSRPTKAHAASSNVVAISGKVS